MLLVLVSWLKFEMVWTQAPNVCSWGLWWIFALCVRPKCNDVEVVHFQECLSPLMLISLIKSSFSHVSLYWADYIHLVLSESLIYLIFFLMSSYFLGMGICSWALVTRYWDLLLSEQVSKICPWSSSIPKFSALDISVSVHTIYHLHSKPP